MRAKLSFNWGLIATGAILAALLTTGAVAVAGSENAIPKGKIYACVTNDFGTLNLSSARAKCPAGQRKIAWNARGKRGVRGVRGVRGPAGTTGPAGRQGLAGQPGQAGKDGAAGPHGPAGRPGAAGPTGGAGPAGAAGVDGLPGEDGAPGENGTNGLNGRDGVDGAQGLPGKDGDPGDTGPPGPAGPGSAMTASSPIDVLWMPNAIGGHNSVLPLNGMATSATQVDQATSLDLSLYPEAIKRIQVLPPDATISSISAWFRGTQAVQLGFPSSIQLSIYGSSDHGVSFVPVAGARCDLGLPPSISVGEITFSECSGLSIPIPSGTIGVIVAELWAPGAPPMVMTGQLATSIGFS